MIKPVWILLGFVAALVLSSCASNRDELTVVPYDLSALMNPFETDGFRPAFSWKTNAGSASWKQGAWQIVVAESEKSLQSMESIAWNSGKVKDGQQLFIPFDGQKLTTGKKYFWQVRVWDGKGRPSAWSEVSSFRIPLDYHKDWKGEWITYDFERSAPMPLLRKSFSLETKKPVVSARLHICGLGYHEAYLNGQKIGDRVLEPAQTNYDDYAFYSIYELDPDGFRNENTLGVMLGNGWFNQYLVWYHDKSYGPPTMSCMLVIEYAGGDIQTVLSDLTWQWKEGPVVFSNIYAGETHDARREVKGWNMPGSSDQGWKPVKHAAIHPPKLVEQTMEPIKKTGTIPVKNITSQPGGVYVFDMGQNFSGWVRLTIAGRRGQEIIMRFSEEVDSLGYIDPGSTGVSATQYVQTSRYICKGEDTEIWEPRFTYHGFRYVEVSGLTSPPGKDLLTGIVVHNALPEAGTFHCANDQINKLNELAKWTLKSNLHSQLTDCPHRERCGWTGDVHAAAPALMNHFNAHKFLAKYMYDMRSSARDAREELYFGEHFGDRSIILKPAGIPTMIVPGKRTSGTASPDWGTAMTQGPWFIYQYYGDTGILKEFYPDMKTWVNYISNIAVDHIVPHGLGDWCPPGSNVNIDCPVPLSSTAFHYLDLTILTNTARLLGHDSDAETYGDIREKVREAFNYRFLDRENNCYGSQTANAMAIQLGLAPHDRRHDIAASLARQVNADNNGFLQTGIFGLGRIFPALAENGQEETAWHLFTKTGYNSFAYMWDRYDATTLWEVLPVDDYYKPGTTYHSHNHPMQAGYDEWLIRGIAGINAHPDHPGYKKIVMRPWFTEWLDHANASYESPYGTITSKWSNDASGFTWQIDIPANTSADLYIPQFRRLGEPSVTGNGKINTRLKKDPEFPDYRVIRNLGSGTYTVVVKH